MKAVLLGSLDIIEQVLLDSVLFLKGGVFEVNRVRNRVVLTFLDARNRAVDILSMPLDISGRVSLSVFHTNHEISSDFSYHCR